MASIELVDLCCSYGETPVLKGVNLSISEGELHTLLGPSGCGKTTTLRLIAGFMHPTSGCILIDGRDVAGLAPEKRSMGVVFQNYALFPQMTVAENVAFGLRTRHVERKERTRIVGESLELVGLSDLSRRNVNELSGGQQQRVAIARALAPSPQVLLMDEPMANLDEALRESLRSEIRRIQKATGVTTLFITHDQQEALGLSDTISVMGEGAICQTGTPRDIYEHPSSSYVAQFIGEMNCLPDKGPGGQALLLRPEQLRLSQTQGPHSLGSVVVRSRRYRGFATEYRVLMENAGGSDPSAPVSVLMLSNGSSPTFAVGQRAFLEEAL